MGDYADLPRSGPTSASGCGATPSTAPATSSATRSSSTPSPTRPSSCPTSWSTRRSRSCTTSSGRRSPARASSEPAYLKATGQTEADLHTEFRPRAEQRIKVLLVLSEDRRRRGHRRPRRRGRGPGRARPRSATRATRRPSRYFESRARPQLHPQHAAPDARRSRRSSTAGSPPTRTIPPLPHLEDDAPSGVDGPRGRGRRIDRRHRPGRRSRASTAAARTTATRPPPKPDHHHPGGHSADRAPRHAADARPSAGETPDARPDGHRIHQPR